MVCVGSAGIHNCGAFGIFMAKGHRNPRIAALYKTAHSGVAIKRRHFWWEKSGANAAMFSSAAAALLLHSFLRVPYVNPE